MTIRGQRPACFTFVRGSVVAPCYACCRPWFFAAGLRCLAVQQRVAGRRRRRPNGGQLPPLAHRWWRERSGSRAGIRRHATCVQPRCRAALQAPAAGSRLRAQGLAAKAPPGLGGASRHGGPGGRLPVSGRWLVALPAQFAASHRAGTRVLMAAGAMAGAAPRSARGAPAEGLFDCGRVVDHHGGPAHPGPSPPAGRGPGPAGATLRASAGPHHCVRYPRLEPRPGGRHPHLPGGAGRGWGQNCSAGFPSRCHDAGF